MDLVDLPYCLYHMKNYLIILSIISQSHGRLMLFWDLLENILLFIRNYCKLLDNE